MKATLKGTVKDMLFTAAYFANHHGDLPAITCAEVCMDLAHDFHELTWSGEQESHIEEMDCFMETPKFRKAIDNCHRYIGGGALCVKA